ncbi:MAG: DNA replication/repair protein RecF, partial [Clostridiales bacterium]|nr:DNA replication/repair protein RecF [Clostridiales bacterium]
IFGMLNIVFFSPEDLNIIKEGPSKRRKFLDMELSQIDRIYLADLTSYNKVLKQRNQLLKDIYFRPNLEETLPVWDEQLINYGEKISLRREEFISQLNEIVAYIHGKISGEREKLVLKYESVCEISQMRDELDRNRQKDKKTGMTSIGPHRDDICFYVNGVDIRKYGSQGQQRTVALSLKLAEIEMMKRTTGETPVLLLDDVLSELDSKRQNYLLASISDIQAIITCTGLDEFVKNRFQINRVFYVKNGKIEEKTVLRNK